MDNQEPKTTDPVDEHIDQGTATAEENDPVRDQPGITLDRLGDAEKCPVCGSHVESTAYHCPTCRNYFCYHCRARLFMSEKQLQCSNQPCDYYGKLVCSVCDREAEKLEPPTVYLEPEDGYWPGWLILVLIAFGLLWYWYSFVTAFVTAIILFLGVGYLIHRLGLNIFGIKRMVEHQRRSTYHTCICCGQPVKEVLEK